MADHARKRKGRRGSDKERAFNRQDVRDTPRRRRRLKHKEMSRKTHSHDRESVPESEKFRCPRCRPLPWRESTAIRPEAGPRDWKPARRG
jgi:hypothetical protein